MIFTRSCCSVCYAQRLCPSSLIQERQFDIKVQKKGELKKERLVLLKKDASRLQVEKPRERPEPPGAKHVFVAFQPIVLFWPHIDILGEVHDILVALAQCYISSRAIGRVVARGLRGLVSCFHTSRSVQAHAIFSLRRPHEKSVNAVAC